MKHQLFLLPALCLLLGVIACQTTAPSTKAEYPYWVGDIAFDPMLDDASFQTCNDSTTAQYFWFDEKTYEGEKIAIEEFFQQHYKAAQAKPETGWLRIRFLVNCRGETGRFRCMGMDTTYREKIFDPSIQEQLLKLTKQLDAWKALAYRGQSCDYYQYLTFKIEAGVLKEILP